MDPPMLPAAGRLPLGQPGWAWEIKWDGVRVLAATGGVTWRLDTRRGHPIHDRFPELSGITDLGDVVLDGELVVLDGAGRLDFGAVLSRMHTTPRRAWAAADERPATVLAFDVLRAGGEDLRRLPYVERRAILEVLAVDGERWAVPPAFEDGPATVAASLELGLEGVVAKRLTSRYTSGRTRSWIKSRHQGVIDVTVAGWVRRASGGVSLLLAEATPEGWRYAGRCTAPRSLVDALIETRVPAVAVPAQSGEVHWVRPELVVEVRAGSREPDGRLRMPRYVRARLDTL